MLPVVKPLTNVMASTSCTYKQFFVEVKTENYYVEMAEAGADEDHWRCTEFRLKVISQIEEAMKSSKDPNMFMKSPTEVENAVYNKSKRKFDYLFWTACVLVSIRNNLMTESTNSEQQRQKEATNMPPQIGMTARVTESSPGQLPMLHNQQIAEMLGSSLQEGDLNTTRVTDSVIKGDLHSREFHKKVNSQFSDVRRVSKKPDHSRKEANTLGSKFYSEAKSEVDGVTYTVRPLSFCPEAGSSKSGALHTTSLRGEKPQVSVFPTAVNNDWHSSSFRQKIISRIAEVKSSLGDLSVGMKEPNQLENEVFCKVKTKKDYLVNIARVLASLREVKLNATAQQNTQLPNLSPQHFKTQDIINIRVVQDTIQQVSKQHFSSTKLSTSSQLSHPSAAEKEHLTTSDDWRSLGFRQKIISRIAQEMKKSNDPKLFIKNPNDMERELYSRAKTRMEYLKHFSRLIISIRKPRSASTVQL